MLTTSSCLVHVSKINRDRAVLVVVMVMHMIVQQKVRAVVGHVSLTKQSHDLLPHQLPDLIAAQNVNRNGGPIPLQACEGVNKCATLGTHLRASDKNQQRVSEFQGINAETCCVICHHVNWCCHCHNVANIKFNSRRNLN